MKLKNITKIIKLAIYGYSIYAIYKKYQTENEDILLIDDFKNKLENYNILDGYLLVEDNIITYNFSTEDKKDYIATYDKDIKEIVEIREGDFSE